ncbi:hypothetical protein PHYBLDRAFT_71215 [Phycomyces blakesleeanus NRRL 1555(-)]|uniref:Uncharacterized protein n=1 Tax=Phycomyces blakesleeanus (strain ATCC 8743b / DSM 1359 / FGSC 10004 / NBRC 33097 / NRRL 1555) TaxID=763407 RepID=A0A162U434_PHYB8|nr:hypothetical protein PHYBLDRAFT_71215 [Phycomyces blakesleeanus NRRL 1555(-)]OAD72193.1 hypothetical protein PHYBLDRAFT_71215 [Phycomyces blakesleeanus NRRL 1555(-)]|eukprot:XP_018290233.1 hypothetical protein PHYBLDRAFT_71215 [Phycomyces blakesleeanus NRRL 1555(-)]
MKGVKEGDQNICNLLRRTGYMNYDTSTRSSKKSIGGFPRCLAENNKKYSCKKKQYNVALYFKQHSKQSPKEKWYEKLGCNDGDDIYDKMGHIVLIWAEYIA